MVAADPHQRPDAVLYPTPVVYATDRHLGAARYWYGEDMPKPGESLWALRRRRDKVTSVLRSPESEKHNDQLMSQMEGRTDPVPYQSAKNGRGPAIICWNLTSLGAEGQE